MTAQERIELTRLRKKEADEKQSEFDKEMAPALDQWQKMKSENGWK